MIFRWATERYQGCQYRRTYGSKADHSAAFAAAEARRSERPEQPGKNEGDGAAAGWAPPAKISLVAASCPVCREPGGWHDHDDPAGHHARARERIPTHLILPPVAAPPRRGCDLDHPHDGPHVLSGARPVMTVPGSPIKPTEARISLQTCGPQRTLGSWTAVSDGC